ncbi:hypothetical protein FSARC_14718 [Fusarium sarcochroum]|uniref:Uncharacterized protein n=1 Tax=Fusarium sarcochroum TaxID=1208366 RepID=A0A8H4WNN5_9HYPO|nr:hypothetical protein FSARC_14718 [Fusarium sarcochroum]
MKVTAMLMITSFVGSALSISIKYTAGSPGYQRQFLITISESDGASRQISSGFSGSCKEYAQGESKGTNRDVDEDRLNINGVGNNFVIDSIKNGRDRRASFTNCKVAVFAAAQCTLKQRGCDLQARSG